VLACAVRLLDLGFFRIGSEDYAERNESFGLTTMLREHVTIGEHELVFDFPAKSGQRRVQEIADEDALAVIAMLKRRRGGSQLLAYRTTNRWTEVQGSRPCRRSRSQTHRGSRTRAPERRQPHRPKGGLTRSGVTG
jgi:DNA topoisomerase I